MTTLPLREVLTTILSLLLVLGTANSKTFFSVIQSRCSLTTSTNKIKVQVYIYRQSVCVHTHKRELLDLNSQHRAGLTFVQRSENTTISRPYIQSGSAAGRLIFNFWAPKMTSSSSSLSNLKATRNCETYVALATLRVFLPFTSIHRFLLPSALRRVN